MQMNRNRPQAAAATIDATSAADSTSRRRASWTLAVTALIVTTLSASLFATPRSNEDDSERVQKICVANGGHWQRTGAGGACIDITEWSLD